jgi:hypothetical protein
MNYYEEEDDNVYSPSYGRRQPIRPIPSSTPLPTREPDRNAGIRKSAAENERLRLET